MKNNTLFNYIKHCWTDDEYQCGGIPTKEKYYFKKLGWKGNDEIGGSYKKGKSTY